MTLGCGQILIGQTFSLMEDNLSTLLLLYVIISIYLSPIWLQVASLSFIRFLHVLKVIMIGVTIKLFFTIFFCSGIISRNKALFKKPFFKFIAAIPVVNHCWMIACVLPEFYNFVCFAAWAALKHLGLCKVWFKQF